MQKGLFILFGECFRDCNNNNKLRDTEFGYTSQKECTNSHLKLINTIKIKYDYDMDIAMNTYDTIYKNDLLNWYETNLVYSNFVNDNYSTTYGAFNNSANNIIKIVDINNYDFIFACRFDILLKDELINIFNPIVDKITYPNIEHIETVHLPFHYPHIVDLFCIIPKKYFNPFKRCSLCGIQQYFTINSDILDCGCFKETSTLTINNWKGFKEHTNVFFIQMAVGYLMQNGLDLQKDFAFFTDRLYPANTIQQTNPYYKINCKPESNCNVIFDANLRYLQKTNQIIDITKNN
jgi:hypothetical protein